MAKSNLLLKEALSLAPEYRDYVWGGSRLRPDAPRTAEAWVVYEGDRVISGSFAGQTLAEIGAQYGEALLGRLPLQRTGLRFPLLVKLLDCAQWLSLQVHPDDEKAVKLEGPGQFGKTESWYFFEADPQAQILCGLRPGVNPEAMADAIRNGTIVDVMQHLDVRAGESIFIPAGMIHALGPGLLLYEVQQTSDITYRVFDWNRPATPQRPLHIDKSLAAADPGLSGKMYPAPSLKDGECQSLVSCHYFTLDIMAAQKKVITLDTRGDSFNALTVVDGSAVVEGDGWSVTLDRFATAVIPAACGVYRVNPSGSLRMLRAYVG